MSFETSEFIALIGQPAFAPVAGTSLLWVSNTDGELFCHEAAGAFCYLPELVNKTRSEDLRSRALKTPDVSYPREQIDETNFAWGYAVKSVTAWHDPDTGTFGRGAVVYGPYGGAGGFAAYYPRTGTYARGGAVYGPYDPT